MERDHAHEEAVLMEYEQNGIYVNRLDVSSINLNKIEYRFSPTNSLHFLFSSMQRYKWVEDDECRKQALNSVNKCSSDCGHKLAPIGVNKDPPFKLKTCDNWSQPTLVNEINFDNLEVKKFLTQFMSHRWVHDLTDRKTLISSVKDCVGAYSLF
ncbi:unnamed protein product [Brugia pahangi]|uniref:ULP_PROTEASE domain-containing protein n=1 Tax=Brugia pahangi TaxID=6280 RepID=A0A0N4TU35_BRUPA|nr:unnamed protein product [Brugia pahangi]